MPHCENCGTKWNWANTLKIGFTNNRKCPSCGERQYVVADTKLRTYIATALPLVILITASNYLDLSTQLTITMAAVFCMVMMAIMPYTIKLSNKQEPLW